MAITDHQHTGYGIDAASLALPYLNTMADRLWCSVARQLNWLRRHNQHIELRPPRNHYSYHTGGQHPLQRLLAQTHSLSGRCLDVAV